MPDKRYDRLNFPIHEYFVAKALDQVRPGGVIAVVTSSYTMDTVSYTHLDVYKRQRFARPLPIWTMHPAFEPEVIETLEATFGNQMCIRDRS